MIVPERVSIGQILRYVGLPLLLLLAWDVFITAVYLSKHGEWEFPALPMPLLATVIAIYLSFRSSTAYARWWEARTLWGALVNSSRSFSREALLFLPSDTRPLQEELILRQIAYVHALRLHLRHQSPWRELESRLSAHELERLRGIANIPDAILRGTADLLKRASIDSVKLATIERTMVELSNAQGGLERIKNTPFPRQYATYPIFFTHVFCVLLPIGLVESLGWYTPLGSTAAGFLFLALLQIGTDMQDPFSNSENDIPLVALCRSIEIDLLESLCERHNLEPIRPEDGILW